MYEYIQTYLSRDIYPFHMPGHKRNAAFLPVDLLRLDMTEFGGMDNLHAPEGVIKTAQAYAAAVYGAEESFFLVNGSSSGVVAAVCACCRDGDVIAVARNTHISAYHGLVFSGASPVFFMPKRTEDGLSGGVLPADIPDDVRTVLITSPTYEGFVSDIKAIADKVHRQGGILIVDEAHGAHFPFHTVFPKTALAQGADIVINSLHKTLPALSQCAVLHVCGPRVDRERLRYYLQATQTTSPSYIIMAAADYMLHRLREHPVFFETYVKRLMNVRQSLPGVASRDAPLYLYNMDSIGSAGTYEMDISKLLFGIRSTINGKQIIEMLAERYALQMEMATDRHILAMTSVADTEEGFTRLINAVECLNRTLTPSEQPQKFAAAPSYPKPEVVLPPREANNYKTVKVGWKNALGCISGMFITPYPPGIPLLAPGERITPAIAEAAAAWKVAGDGIKIINRS